MPTWQAQRATAGQSIERPTSASARFSVAIISLNQTTIAAKPASQRQVTSVRALAQPILFILRAGIGDPASRCMPRV
jgi:hypothetical protein